MQTRPNGALEEAVNHNLGQRPVLASGVPGDVAAGAHRRLSALWRARDIAALADFWLGRTATLGTYSRLRAAPECLQISPTYLQLSPHVKRSGSRLSTDPVLPFIVEWSALSIACWS